MQRDDLRAVRDAMNPSWDDLREQRLLRGVRTHRAQRVQQRRALRIVAACLGALAVVALVVGFGSRFRPSPAPTPAAVASFAPPAGSAGSVLSLADGSRLSIQPNADVHVETQTPEEVRLVQRAGEVFYDVTPDPQRRFEVHAANVLVRVKGTAFRVRVDADAVFVHVDRGRVVVEDGTSSAELGVGEELKRAVRLESPAASASAPEPAPPASVASPALADSGPTVEELLARADRARASGQLGEAASALQEILTRHPKDRRVGTARFTLGRVERARGNHAAAAAHFHACCQGFLAEDALAEEASSWVAAGQTANAQSAARRYLDRFPNGPHVARMRRIVE